jgi:CBS domain-containing protein
MRREFVTVDSDDQLDFADQVMRLGRIRHIPVLEEGRLLGVVSNRDLLAASLTTVLRFDSRHRSAFLRSIDVKEVMTREVKTVGPATPLADAARILIKNKIGCLPVVDGEGALVGLLTETDLLRAAFLEPEAWQETDEQG